MNEPPRPSSLGEILDRTAQIYRSRFLVLFGIAAVPTAVVLVFASAIFLFFAWFGSSGAGSAPNGEGGFLVGLFLLAFGLVALPIFLGVTALATAAMNHAANHAWLNEKTTIREAYKAAWRRGWRSLWLYVAQALLIWAAPMTAWFLLFGFGALGAAIVQKLGGGAATGALFATAAIVLIFALAGYSLWMLLRLSLAFPACVVEQMSAWTAIKRSATLSKGTRGRIFLLYLLGTALNYLLSIALAVPVLIVASLVPGANTPQHEQTMGMVMLFTLYGGSFAVQALTRPVFGVALMLFYYDQRIRLEGFDIEWMMQQAGLVVPSVQEKEAVSWLSALPVKAAPPQPVEPEPPQPGGPA
jgi:hypothetical protein